MIDIFDDKNKVDPQPVVEDKEYEEMLAKIAAMSVEELWGGDEPEQKKEPDMLTMILEAFPGSRVLSPLEALLYTDPVPKTKSLSDLLDKAPAEEPVCLVEALRLLSEGKPVIPIGDDKRPIIRWEKYITELPTEAEVRQWWRQWPSAQLGMPTGKLSGVSVIDVEADYGDPADLGFPDTTVVRTGGGGYHFYFKHRDGITNTAKVNGKPIDVRGQGGFVVVPPSKTAKGGYTYVKKIVELPPFPEEYVPKRYEPMSTERVNRFETEDGGSDYPGYGMGERDVRMTEWAGVLFANTARKLWDSTILHKLEADNQKNDPPLSDFEVKKIYESIYKRESAKIDAAGGSEISVKEQEKIEKEYLERTGGDDKLVQYEVAAEVIASKRTKRYHTGLATIDEAFRGGVTTGEVYIVTGLSGHGKTTYMQNICMNLEVQGIPSIFLSYETAFDAINERFREMGLPSGYRVYTPKIIPGGHMIYIKQKITEGKTLGCQAIFIDMLQYLEPSAGTKKDELRISYVKLMLELKRLAVSEEIMIFATAHVAKIKDWMVGPSMQDIKESSSIYQDVDGVISVHREAYKTKESIDHPTESGKKIKVDSIKYSGTVLISILKNRPGGNFVTERCYYDNGVFSPTSGIPQVKSWDEAPKEDRPDRMAYLHR